MYGDDAPKGKLSSQVAIKPGVSHKPDRWREAARIPRGRDSSGLQKKFKTADYLSDHLFMNQWSLCNTLRL